MFRFFRLTTPGCVFLALVTLACFPVLAVPARYQSASQFPELIGFSKGKKDTYGDPALGYSMSYFSRDGMAITVYVYNGGHPTIPEGTASQLVQEEQKSAAGEIYEMGRLGKYGDVKQTVHDEVRLGTSAKAPRALHIGFTLTKEGVKKVSDLYIVGHKNNFVKIRSTRNLSTREKTAGKLSYVLGKIGTMLSK
jgi:hypothetical protein